MKEMTMGTRNAFIHVKGCKRRWTLLRKNCDGRCVWVKLTGEA
jgi:hypothetical protein